MEVLTDFSEQDVPFKSQLSRVSWLDLCESTLCPRIDFGAFAYGVFYHAVQLVIRGLVLRDAGLVRSFDEVCSCNVRVGCDGNIDVGLGVISGVEQESQLGLLLHIK